MKPGDRIRIPHFILGIQTHTTDHVVEEYRWCLGVFMTEDDRTAGRFTPLCELYEAGPNSERRYISNYGDYLTNQVQGWMDLPRENNDEM